MPSAVRMICSLVIATWALSAGSLADSHDSQDAQLPLTDPSPKAGARPSGMVDEQGIKTKRKELESKGLELYRSPAGNFSLNVGVHSMYIYSVTQCVPLKKDFELRFAVKQIMAPHAPDGQNELTVPTGEANTAGSVSFFLAF